MLDEKRDLMSLSYRS